jgi:hypothetical protein
LNNTDDAKRFPGHAQRVSARVSHVWRGLPSQADAVIHAVFDSPTQPSPNLHSPEYFRAFPYRPHKKDTSRGRRASLTFQDRLTSLTSLVTVTPLHLDHRLRRLRGRGGHVRAEGVRGVHTDDEAAKAPNWRERIWPRGGTDKERPRTKASRTCMAHGRVGGGKDEIGGYVRTQGETRGHGFEPRSGYPRRYRRARRRAPVHGRSLAVQCRDLRRGR